MPYGCHLCKAFLDLHDFPDSTHSMLSRSNVENRVDRVHSSTFRLFMLFCGKQRHMGTKALDII